MLSDRPELPTTAPEFEALVARIHENLRRERRARKWREGAGNLRKALLAAVLLLTSLVIGFYLSVLLEISLNARPWP